MSKIFASQKERFTIALLLNQHCSTTAEGYARYEDGWDDRRVAKEAGRPEIITSVENIRREVYGRLYVVPGSSNGHNYDDLLRRIVAIEHKLGIDANG